jgi:hypothetical protein
MAKPREGDIKKTPGGSFLSLTFLERIAALPPRLTPPEGWVSHARLVEVTKTSDAAIKSRISSGAVAMQRGIFKKDGITDVWYDGHTAQSVVAWFSRLKRTDIPEDSHD